MIRSGRVPRLLAAATVLVAATVASAVAPEKPIQVRLAKGSAADDSAWLAASVAAEQRATVSTRLSAQVRSVAVEEGSRVKQGQLLLTLGDEDVRAQLVAAETALANAKAYERRIEELAKQRAATTVELEAAQAQRAQAAAAVAAANASVAYTRIRAPFDGTVQARRVQPGDLVGPGQPLVELEGSGLELQASLSEQESAGLRIGQRLRYQSGASRGEAVITALTTGGDALTHRRTLRARILAPGTLRSGAFARLEVPGAARGSEGALRWVPRTAVVRRGDLVGVFIADGSVARLRWISAGEEAGDGVAVRAGLGAGERVIDVPGALQDGQPVEVVP